MQTFSMKCPQDQRKRVPSSWASWLYYGGLGVAQHMQMNNCNPLYKCAQIKAQLYKLRNDMVV